MSDEHETNEERKPWDQMEGESSLWYGRFRAYLQMGFKRSVNAVFQSEGSRENPRGEAQGHWYEESKRYQWQERAKAYDENWIEEQDKIIAQEKERVLRSGYALMHKRIEQLNRLAEKLIAWSDEDDKAWIPETRTVIGEKEITHIDKLTFNAPMFSLIDRYFDSIAKETGERVKKKEIEHKGLPPNVYLGFNPDDDGSVTQEKEDEVEG